MNETLLYYQSFLLYMASVSLVVVVFQWYVLFIYDRNLTKWLADSIPDNLEINKEAAKQLRTETYQTVSNITIAVLCVIIIICLWQVLSCYSSSCYLTVSIDMSSKVPAMQTFQQGAVQ